MQADMLLAVSSMTLVASEPHPQAAEAALKWPTNFLHMVASHAAPNIQCYARHERSRLALVTHEDFPLNDTGTAGISATRSLIISNRQAYADRHGYSHCVSRWKSQYVPTTHVRYVLLYALLHGLEYDIQEFEIALWLDFDVVILDLSKALLPRLGKHTRAADLVVNVATNIERPDVVNTSRQQLCWMPPAVDTSETMRACIKHVRKATAVGRSIQGLAACFNTGVFLTRRSTMIDEWLQRLLDISRMNLTNAGPRGHRASRVIFGDWITDPEAATMAVIDLPAQMQTRVRAVSSDSLDMFWPFFHAQTFMLHFNALEGIDKYELMRRFMLADSTHNETKTRLDVHSERFSLIVGAWKAHIRYLRLSRDRNDIYARVRTKQFKCTAVPCRCSTTAGDPVRLISPPCSQDDLVVASGSVPQSVAPHANDDPIPMCSTLPEKQPLATDTAGGMRISRPIAAR